MISYQDAMRVESRAQAKAIFELLVVRCMSMEAMPRAKAEELQRNNLAYTAGYYDRATRARVELYFGCVHPMFGPVADNGQPTGEQAFWIGCDKATAEQGKLLKLKLPKRP